MNKIIFNDATTLKCLTDIPSQTMAEVKGKGVKAIQLMILDSLLNIKKSFSDSLKTSLIKLKNEDTGVITEFSGYTNLVSITYDPSVETDDEAYLVTMSLPVDIESLINSISNTIEKVQQNISSVSLSIEDHAQAINQINDVTGNFILTVNHINDSIDSVNTKTSDTELKIDQINSELVMTNDAINTVNSKIDNTVEDTDRTVTSITNEINNVKTTIKEITAVPNIDEMSLEDAKAYQINQSKVALEEFLASNPIVSMCHGNVEKRYSITSEKQQYLTMMIMMASLAIQKGVDYQPSWNATGEACTYNWTIEELQQLAIEIETVVRPLISRQQKLEKEIRACVTIEDIKSIAFDYII